VSAHSGSDGAGAAVSASAIDAVLRAVRGRRTPLVVIDGPSGAGKSTFADALVRAWPGQTPDLVRLDEVYPGWHGLDAAGTGLARTLLAQRRRGRVGGWRRWDWAAERAAEETRVRPGRGMVLEGCGSFAAAEHDPEAVHVWVEASDPVRRRRALARDDGAFDDFWEIWDRQWRRHARRCESRRHADVVVRATVDEDAAGVRYSGGASASATG
jgi:energy-coupling factor transporter ATP-binding protein EcfA2